ncbi:CRISPR-associated helicase Cas3' [bacterium]|nr:CRISPR-associated helicase Cas3' [bacterium]
MEFYAHTKKDQPKSEWQKLSHHLIQTSEIVAGFSNCPEYCSIFKLAGLLHDFGKYQIDFQKYLENGGRRGSVPHAAWGAGFAKILGYNDISIVIDGHHKGLPDRAHWKNDVIEFEKRKIPEFNEVMNLFLDDIKSLDQGLEVDKVINNNPFEYEFFIRYLFSSLTDADWLDTERFCNPDLYNKRENRILDYDFLIQKLERDINGKSKQGELNELRNKVRENAILKSRLAIGFFSMNLPTGMGKTLASISWALNHAKEHNLERIIIVLPFINIIDQTSQILKEIFGEEWVLEHHSGNNENLETAEHNSHTKSLQKLACENWDYPIIVTTTVQFFESLFSNRPSRTRKLHNIAKSVVIFDEVQSLPKHLILPTLEMLNNVHKIMKVSFLFCTATLPAFESRKNFKGIDHIESLVKDPANLFDKTRRVTYYQVHGTQPIKIEELALLVANRDQSVLSVFNTKKSAREFFDCAKTASEWDAVYHLSTAMCPHHRKQTIRNIREDLRKKLKILVSSTQLIEAGVDFDFPCVFREVAPLESIIQAAGRCNREGKMLEMGSVFIFRLIESGMPDKLYRSISDFALEMISESIDGLYQHEFFKDYYQKIINLFVDTDKKNINQLRRNFNFETVAEVYRIIDKSTQSLFIKDYSDDSDEIFNTLLNQEFLSKEDYRRIQQYSVQTYENFIINNRELISEDLPGFKVWYGVYDNYTGISVEPFCADQLIV